MPTGPGSGDADRGLFIVPDLVVESGHYRVHTTIGMGSQSQPRGLVPRCGEHVPTGPGSGDADRGLFIVRD